MPTQDLPRLVRMTCPISTHASHTDDQIDQVGPLSDPSQLTVRYITLEMFAQRPASPDEMPPYNRTLEIPPPCPHTRLSPCIHFFIVSAGLPVVST